MKRIYSKRLLYILLIIVIGSYLFWGPFFPWNPVKTGFEKIESSGAVVYFKDFGGQITESRIEELILETEVLHDLKFRKRFKIIVTGTDDNMKRYLPWLKGSGYSVKLGFVNVIYIGPTGRNSPFGIEVFIKHEMSHLLIHQNVSSARNNYIILEQGWLAEGIATYFGGPCYFEKKEFGVLWKDQGMAYDNLYKENPLKMDKNLIRLKYTYYRFFIEFLVESYGLNKLQTYLKKYILDPGNYENFFPEVYLENMSEILSGYSSYMEEK